MHSYMQIHALQRRRHYTFHLGDRARPRYASAWGGFNILWWTEIAVVFSWNFKHNFTTIGKQIGIKVRTIWINGSNPSIDTLFDLATIAPIVLRVEKFSVRNLAKVQSNIKLKLLYTSYQSNSTGSKRCVTQLYEPSLFRRKSFRKKPLKNDMTSFHIILNGIFMLFSSN